MARIHHNIYGRWEDLGVTRNISGNHQRSTEFVRIAGKAEYKGSVFQVTVNRRKPHSQRPIDKRKNHDIFAVIRSIASRSSALPVLSCPQEHFQECQSQPSSLLFWLNPCLVYHHVTDFIMSCACLVRSINVQFSRRI